MTKDDFVKNVVESAVGKFHQHSESKMIDSKYKERLVKYLNLKIKDREFGFIKPDRGSGKFFFEDNILVLDMPKYKRYEWLPEPVADKIYLSTVQIIDSTILLSYEASDTPTWCYECRDNKNKITIISVDGSFEVIVETKTGLIQRHYCSNFFDVTAEIKNTIEMRV
jgi:hypothetical protein